jgi:hypothetical protein
VSYQKVWLLKPCRKFTKIVLLSLIAIVQMLTIQGLYPYFLTFFGSNPFGSYILPLILLGLFLTIVLLVDEIYHKPELNTLEACSPPSSN